MSGVKDDRLQIRVNPEEKRLLEQAAAVSHVSVSAFVLQAAAEHAQEVLADRRVFIVDEARWDAFLALLDRPEQDVPGLKELLETPSVLDEA